MRVRGGKGDFYKTKYKNWLLRRTEHREREFIAKIIRKNCVEIDRQRGFGEITRFVENPTRPARIKLSPTEWRTLRRNGYSLSTRIARKGIS